MFDGWSSQRSEHDGLQVAVCEFAPPIGVSLRRVVPYNVASVKLQVCNHSNTVTASMFKRLYCTSHAQSQHRKCEPHAIKEGEDHVNLSRSQENLTLHAGGEEITVYVTISRAIFYG